MGDMGEIFRTMKEHDRVRRQKNLNQAQTVDDGKWTKHTDYHWSREVNGLRLDYWPTRNKFQYRNRIHCGDVIGFIRNREKKHSKDQNKLVDSVNER